MGKWRKPHGRELRWNRTQLLRRDGNLCQLCQEPMKDMNEVTIDHIQPLSKGGTDRLDNLRLVHDACNQERGPGFFTTELPGTGEGSK